MSKRVAAPKYRLHKPNGRAVVTVNGRDVYLGQHGLSESRAEYRRIVAEYLATGAASDGRASVDLTIAELLDRFRTWADGYYRLPTGEACSSSARAVPLRARGPRVRIFRPPSVAEFRAQRTASRTTPAHQGNRIGSNRKRQPKRAPGDHYTVVSYGRAVRLAADKAARAAKHVVLESGGEISHCSRSIDSHSHLCRCGFGTQVTNRGGILVVCSSPRCDGRGLSSYQLALLD